MDMTMYGIVVFLGFLGLTMTLPLNQTRVETDPELTAGYVEGDMALDSLNRNGMRDEVLRWPDNIVYYKFFTEFDEPHKNHIIRSMKILEDVSCIRFKEASDDIVNFVNITGFADGCYSSVGWRNHGAQKLNIQMFPLDMGCFRLGVVVHELLHTLGFYHMQNAANRDEYVYIAEENIQSGTAHAFLKRNETETDDFDEEYDYGSILHYQAYAFSSNGKRTIVPLNKDPSVIMGQRRGLSKSDVNKLNVMYRCPIKI